METDDLSDLCDANSRDLKLKGFKVYEIESEVSRAPTYNRRDYFGMHPKCQLPHPLCRQEY